LAACHVPDAKLFIFSEAATMKVKPGEAALELEIAGKFHSRRIPCQEADLVVHLTKADSLRLLGAAYQIVRAGL
jgi:hypothetical protein